MVYIFLMEDVELICKTIPEQAEKIRELYSNDGKFQQVCQDYLEADLARKYWNNSGSENSGRYSEQYLILVSELKVEILQMIQEMTAMENWNE